MSSLHLQLGSRLPTTVIKLNVGGPKLDTFTTSVLTVTIATHWARDRSRGLYTSGLVPEFGQNCKQMGYHTPIVGTFIIYSLYL